MKMKYIMLFDKIADELKKDVILNGLGHDPSLYKEIRKLIGNHIKIHGFSGVSKVPFQSCKVLVDPLLKRSLLNNNETAKLIFKGYFLSRDKNVEIVSRELKKLGYKVVKPDFSDDEIHISLLHEKDIFDTGDNLRYFRPQGMPISGISDEESTILAFLMSWSVMESDEEKAEEDSELTKTNNVGEKQEIDVSIKIGQLNEDFITSGNKLLQIAEYLLVGKIPNDEGGIEILNTLKTRFYDLLGECGFDNSMDITSIEVLRERYENNKLAKQIIDNENNKIRAVLQKYRTIYHIKDKPFSFFHELDNLADHYEKEISTRNDAIKEVWHENILNEKHFFNYLIKAIEHRLVKDYDESAIDEILDVLEKECEQHSFSFYKILSNQINRGNLAFWIENSPEPPLKHKETIGPYIISENVHAKNLISTEDTEKVIVEKNQAGKLTETHEEAGIKDVTDNIPVNESEKKTSNLDTSSKDVLAESDTPMDHEKSKKIKLEPEKNLSIEDLNIFKLLEKGEPELAYHLALCYEAESKKLYLPSYLLCNLFLSLKIRTSTSPIAQKITGNFNQYDLEAEKTDLGQFKNQLVFASLIRPSIFAFNTTGAGILINEVYSGQLSEFSDIKKTIYDFMTHNGGILNFELLSQLSDEATLIENKKKFKQRLEQWLEKAKLSRYKNMPTHHYSRAYHNWVKEEGWIHETIRNFIEKEDGLVLQDFRDNELEESTWKKRYDKELKSFVEKTKYLYGNNEAIRWIYNQIDDLKELLNEGIGYYLHVDRRTSEYHYSRQKLLDFVNEIFRQFETIKQLIESESKETRILDVSARYLLKAFDNLKMALNLKESLSTSLNLDKITNSPLLKLPFYESDPDGIPIRYDNQLAENILNLLNSPDKSLNEIAKQHLISGNYEAFQRMKEDFGDEITAIDDDNNETKYIQNIEYHLKKVKTEIERGCSMGYIINGERLSLISYIHELEKGIIKNQKFINFPLLKSKLDDVKQKIDADKTRLINESKKIIPSNIREEEQEKLLTYLNRGNLLVFNELIERIKVGQFVFTEEMGDVFKNFFHDYLSKAKSGDIALVKKAVKEKSSYCGINFSILSDHQLNEAEELINIWYQLILKKNLLIDNDKQSLIFMLEAFGLKSPSLGESVSFSKTIYTDFTCIPISGKNKTPIPHFGSAAQGKYRLICIFENMIEEDLIEEIKEVTPENNRVPIVIYFSWMKQNNWIELAKLSRTRKRTFLLLDESMFIFLCGVKESKFPVFIKLASPFIYAEPYQTASSNLPEEMFYGRKSQISKLKNIIGDYSCLIYGGRQLGKTVLQREVERVFHDPERNHFALYVDLREKGIGFWNKIEHIASVLYEVLKSIPNIFPEKQPSNYGLQFVLSKLEEWFKANTENRILLFLDEADEFLKQDSEKEFQNISQLKGLMEKTEKRFKIIFSGLHDVRRTIRIPNNPLAHLGTPICVGAMLDKEEAIEAQNLIRMPLQTLGFEFESEDLILMILSYCNWYPSLIQIFCNSLLTSLYEKRFLKSLPIVITENDITNAYERSRNHIKEKFHLTLGLDERYDLLANIIAGETYETYHIQNEGMSVEDIAEYATIAWPSGFDNTNPKIEVNNLLEEMVDLGILRTEERGKYAMRTPNLLGLVGEERLIRENLDRTDRNLPQKFNREISRIIYKKEKREVRSPFPAIYFDNIIDTNNKVMIFKGSKMGGLEYIEEFLTSRKRELQLIVPDMSEFASFEDEDLWRFVEKKRIQGVLTIIFFNHQIVYSINDVKKVYEKIGKKESLSAIFLMSPGKAWNILSEDHKAFEKLENHNIQIYNIPQWKAEIAKEWFRETECSSADISEIFSLIGNWHYLLDQYHSRIIEKPELWREKLHDFYNELVLDKTKLLNDFGIIADHFQEVINELIIYDGDFTKQEYISDKKTEDAPFTGENYLNYLSSLNIIDNSLKVNLLIKKLLDHG